MVSFIITWKINNKPKLQKLPIKMRQTELNKPKNWPTGTSVMCSLWVSESPEPGPKKILSVTGIMMEKGMQGQNVWLASSSCRLIIFRIETRLGEALKFYLNDLDIVSTTILTFYRSMLLSLTSQSMWCIVQVLPDGKTLLSPKLH